MSVYRVINDILVCELGEGLRPCNPLNVVVSPWILVTVNTSDVSLLQVIITENKRSSYSHILSLI